tara:strand:+ start:1125 stop:1736 length:612 start_codon:yes stop_codon:yes gene_type:complete
MKKVTKKLQRFIDSISTIGDSNIPDDDGKIYYSNVDGSYLTRVGMENELNFLLKRGVTEQIQDGYGEPKSSCIGFNPTEQKWYGWSHRAMFGFGVGSECKKGHNGYSADNKLDFAEENLNWYGDANMDDTYKINATVKEHTESGVLGVLVEYDYDDKVPNEATRGTHRREFEPYPKTFGKGEWTAKTLDEAREMAVDFAKGVS